MTRGNGNSDLVIGVDLGTTNSLAGSVVDGGVVVFSGSDGDELLPSVVGADTAGALLVGRAAKNRRLLDPEGTVVEVKRKMGSDARLRVGCDEMSPQQVSALILSALIDRAEAAVGRRPTRALITVPAFFDDPQRQATRDAGEIAGLAVERLVNEPTAAAVSYETGGEELVLVYDFGGGTFDVSILERDRGFLEVKTSRGDTNLGGTDIDRALIDHVLAELGSERSRVEADPRALTRLGETVERAKIALAERDEVRLFEPFLAGEGDRAVHLDRMLTLAELDRIAAPFVERTLAAVDEALKHARLEPRALDRVLLVGGSSRLRAVARRVTEHLGRPVQVDELADRRVARGASLLAGRAAGLEVEEILVDITPHTLSAGVRDPLTSLDELVASPVILRDTVIPTERKETYYTTHDDQEVVWVPIVQGEQRYAEDNTELGEVCVSGLPGSPRGSLVELTFRLDLSGVLNVTALHVASGKSARTEITNSPSRLSEQRRRTDRAQVEQLRARSDVSSEGKPASDADRALAQAMLARAAHALEAEGGSDPARASLKRAIERVTSAAENRSGDLQEALDALSDALLELT
jgi:molecular chaperone DnaK